MPCQHADWSPIAGAGAKSGFAALLAGFVFACLVTVITSRGQGRSEDTVTIRLFLSAFVCLVADSFVALQLADNDLCPRAWTESMIYNSLLTIGVVAILSGVAWLVSGDSLEKTSSLDPRSHADLQRFVVLLTDAVAAVAVVHLAIGTRGYLYALTGHRLPMTWYGWVVFLYAPGLILLGASLIWLARRPGRRLAARARRDRRQGWLRVAGAATAVVVLVQMLVLSFVGDLSYDLWANPPQALIALGATTPLLLAAIPVLSLVLALPPLPTRAERRAPPAQEPPAQEPPTQGPAQAQAPAPE